MENKLAEGSQQFLKALGEVDQVGSFIVHILTCMYLNTTPETGRIAAAHQRNAIGL
jgi:hypothetical protein